ncbi:unnamed protein product [Cladocopium goreaui]|uniref:Uncharacterized protein n=1 Tax=Cladocopium goreaui TaxID=2562237 RepID=A0A9P1GF38_9DINO|nr:unnamed protein product [Cladocopium goreaui]
MLQSPTAAVAPVPQQVAATSQPPRRFISAASAEENPWWEIEIWGEDMGQPIFLGKSDIFGEYYWNTGRHVA